MDSIMKRRSIRKYTDQDVPEEIVEEILRAGMSAPSAGSEEPWHYIVIRNKETLKKVSEHHFSGWMLKDAPVGIIVCCDLNLQRYPGVWVQDCAAATENMLIEAVEQGMGAVWIGVYPSDEVIAALRDIFNLSENIVPFSIVSIGYPNENKTTPDRYNPERVHFEKW